MALHKHGSHGEKAGKRALSARKKKEGRTPIPLTTLTDRLDQIRHLEHPESFAGKKAKKVGGRRRKK